jgi:transcriptional regulator with XRE-family HTH domain
MSALVSSAELGNRLKAARTKAGIEIEDAAAEIGVEPEVWLAWENGRAEPDFSDGMKACRLLGIEPDALVFE